MFGNDYTPRPRLRGVLCGTVAATIVLLSHAVSVAQQLPPLDQPILFDRQLPELPPATAEIPTASARPAAQILQALPPVALDLPANAYVIGDPTDEEQFYLELINRARANPQTEALRLKASTDPLILYGYSVFGVDLNLMVSQFASIVSRPPLSFEPRLITAARRQTNDMFTHGFQSHTGSDGSTISTRISGAGYVASAVAENIYASSFSVPFGHAGFEVDWGNGTGGMQSPALHRIIQHSGTYREVGIGVTDGPISGLFGPQYVTEDFASRSGILPMITGVAYYDVDGDGAYSLREGIGGLQVTVPGSSYVAVTSNSGGYSVPMPADGSYAATFSGLGFPGTTLSATISGGNNTKLDFTPAYTAPVISGSHSSPVGQSSTFSFLVVPGAAGYNWRSQKALPSGAVDDAEHGVTTITPYIDSDYTILADTPYVYQGSHSYHLAHAHPRNQYLQLNRSFRASAQSVLKFYSMLTWATPTQKARVEVRVDGSSNWQPLAWEIAGTGDAGPTTFSPQSISLAQFQGKQIWLQFVFAWSNTYITGADGKGLYLDNIEVDNAEELTDLGTQAVSSGTSFQFATAVAATHILQAAPIVGGRQLPWGPTFDVVGVASKPGAPSNLKVIP